MTADVLIVEPLEPEVAKWLEARHGVRHAPELANDVPALRLALRDARAAIVPPALPLDARTLHQARRLRAIGRISGGAEEVDLAACNRAGIEIVRGVGATAQAEAEFMLGALLAMLRGLPHRAAQTARVGRELGSSTLGLIGLSPAARVAVGMLAGFGSRIVGYDPAVHANDPAWARWRVEPLPIHQLLQEADAICVQLDLFSRYRGLLGARYLPYCKPGQVVVSVGHSAIFDEATLAGALRSGRIAAAWFDSMEPGALAPGRPLAGIDSLHVTPCIASTTRESRLRSAWEVARRIDQLLRQGDMRDDPFMQTVPGALPDPAADPARP
jgi:phosphoglycerate dehydrogenase-like enzyme